MPVGKVDGRPAGEGDSHTARMYVLEESDSGIVPMNYSNKAKLEQIQQQLRARMHHPVVQTGKWLQSVVQGYFHYHAVPGNLDSLGVFRERVTRLWRGTLRDRSQTHRVTWTRMHRLAVRWLPQPRVLHPYPEDRFAVRYLRQEPYALMSASTDLCGGC